MSYNGTIDVISGFRPKNNGDVPLVTAKDVQVGDDGERLDAALERLKTGISSNTANIADLRDDYNAFKENTNLNLDDIYNQIGERQENNSGSGGGGVSSWNDLTDKPFYYNSETSQIFDNSSMPSSSSTMNGIPFIGHQQVITEDVYNKLAVEGKKCIITVDGNEFTCVCKWVEGNGLAWYAYGNTDAFLGTGNTGESFIMIPGWNTVNNQTVYFLVMIYITDTQATDHVCSLYTLEETLKKLDAKYHDDEHIRSIVDEVINEALGGEY